MHERLIVFHSLLATVAEPGLVKQIAGDIDFGAQEVASGGVHRVHEIADSVQIVADRILLRYDAEPVGARLRRVEGRQIIAFQHDPAAGGVQHA